MAAQKKAGLEVQPKGVSTGNNKAKGRAYTWIAISKHEDLLMGSQGRGSVTNTFLARSLATSGHSVKRMREDVSRTDERVLCIAADVQRLMDQMKKCRAEQAELQDTFETRVRETINHVVAAESDNDNTFGQMVFRTNALNSDLDTIWDYVSTNFPQLFQRMESTEDLTRQVQQALDTTDSNLAHALVRIHKMQGTRRTSP